MTPDTIIAIISAVLTGLASGIAVVAIKSSRKEKNLDLSHKTYEEIDKWYEDVDMTMGDLFTPLYNNEQLSTKERISYTKHLAHLIRRSFRYFKNNPDGTRQNKATVYRGKNSIIRDILVLYYDIFAKKKEKQYKVVLGSLISAITSELTLYLEQNMCTDTIVPYQKYDATNLLNINSLETNPMVEKILCNGDIVETFSNLDNFNQKLLDLSAAKIHSLEEQEEAARVEQMLHMYQGPSLKEKNNTIYERIQQIMGDNNPKEQEKPVEENDDEMSNTDK